MSIKLISIEFKFRFVLLTLGIVLGLSSVCLCLYLFTKPAFVPPRPTAELFTIVLPETTPTVYKISLTPDLENELTEIKLNSYVQITGTEKEGLRLRAGPGKDYNQLFLGMESEVFEVNDGPVTADGYTWWYLVAPYDKNRSGWAASDYLVRINPD